MSRAAPAPAPAFALAALLAVFAGARAQSQCTTKTIGSNSGGANRLQDQYMLADVREWVVAVPPDACLLGTYQVGTTVTACDEDSPPVVSLDKLVSGLVHRTGDLKSYGVIEVTVYCAVVVNRRYAQGPGLWYLGA